jgi:hypothetical protein
MESDDGGRHWQRRDGSPIVTPARPGALDTLLESHRTRVEATPHPEVGPAGVVVDSRGTATLFHISHHERPGAIVMTRWSGGAWQSRELDAPLLARWPDMRATGCVATIRDDDALCLLVPLTPFDGGWIDGKPSRAMGMRERTDRRLVWMVSRDTGSSFDIVPCFEPGRAFNNPSVELPTGANRIPGDRLPAFLTYDGSNAYPGGGEYYNKPVAEMLAAGEFHTTQVFVVGAGD